MTTDLAIVVAGAVGSVCLLTACIAHLRQQRFRLGGAMLSLCGVALLGLSSWQIASRPASQEQALSELSGQLDEIGRALQALENKIAQVAERDARLSAAVSSFKQEHDAALAAIRAQAVPARATGGQPAASSGPATAEDRASPAASTVLEIEVIGGVSDEELAEIVAWIEEIKAEHRVSEIFVEPVMPYESTDLDGQRKRLMSEAGRVMDHVYEQINQRMGIANLVSEDVPGPRLRLGFSGA